jgi:hypothetical protein
MRLMEVVEFIAALSVTQWMIFLGAGAMIVIIVKLTDAEEMLIRAKMKANERKRKK